MEKQNIRPKHSGSKQLFENPILERLSRTHIAIPVTLFFLTGMVLLYLAFTYAVLDNSIILSLFLLGFFGFTFIEYWVHRSIYHIEPTTETRSKFQYMAHGVHHEYPKDKTRLAMPPVIAILIVGLLFSFTYFALNNYAFAFFPGFIWGYASYLLVHYCVHAYPPPNNYFKMLWVNHAVHHYKDGNAVFGVSSPIWDYVFGTMDTMDKNNVQENL